MATAEASALAEPSAHRRSVPDTVATVVGHGQADWDIGDESPDSGGQDTAVGLDINPGHGLDSGAVSGTRPDTPMPSVGRGKRRVPLTAGDSDASAPDWTPAADTDQKAPPQDVLPAAPAQDTPFSPAAYASQRNATSTPELLSPVQSRYQVREPLWSSPAITGTEVAQQINVSPRNSRRYRNEILR